MSLRDERKEQQKSGNRTIFRDGIRSVRLSQKNVKTVFRLLPAFNPNDPNPATSYLPCVDPDGEPTDWGKFVYMSGFLGHGVIKRDIVSPRTFHKDAPCPLTALGNAIMQDKTTWQYMTKDDPTLNTRKCFAWPSPILVMNVMERSHPELGVALGMMTKSAGNSLLTLCCARNTNPQFAALVEQNYLYGFANGDITDPNAGLVLTCGIPAAAAKGDFSEYVVEPLLITDPVTRATKTQPAPLTQDLLALRYRIDQPETYIEPRSYEEIVQELVGIYNKRSPSGMHEYYLLRLAFPEHTHLIPEPPPAPAALSTVSAGWGGAPAGAPATPPVAGPFAGGGGFPAPAAPVTGPFAGAPATPPVAGPFAGGGGFPAPAAPVTGPFAGGTTPPTPAAPIPPQVSPEKARIQQAAVAFAAPAQAPGAAPVAVPGDTPPALPGTESVASMLQRIGVNAAQGQPAQ